MRSLLCTVVVLVASLALVHGQQDRINLRTKLCAPFSLAECQNVAQNCLDFSKSVRENFSDRSTGVSCGSEQGINFLQLWWASSADKTNREVLADAGATPEQAQAITRCVLTRKGFASNNVLNVNKVKSIVQSSISQGNFKEPKQNAAMLTAVNRCSPPSIDTMRDYILCITKACVHRN